MEKPSIENKNGFLYKIAAALQAELTVPDAKIMLSEATKAALREDVELQLALQKNFSGLHQIFVDADILPLKPQKFSSKMQSAESKTSESAEFMKKTPTSLAPSAPLPDNVVSRLPVPSAPPLENSEVKKEEKYTRIAELLHQVEQQKLDLPEIIERLQRELKEKENQASQLMRKRADSPIFDLKHGRKAKRKTRMKA